MTATHEDGPLTTRRRCLSALSATALGLTVGCHSFDLFGNRTEKKDEAQAPTPPPGAPWKYTIRQAPYLFFSDFELDPRREVFRELAGLRDQVCRELRLPPGDAVIQVYLFEDRDRYKEFMARHHPKLPDRRAFFIQHSGMGSANDLLVYAYRDERRIQQDLRHELTHALLHSVLKEVPIWLDEGLAEYFELPPANRGVNRDHLDDLRRPGNSVRLDLARLEAIREVKDMNAAEYCEAWAWAHFLLQGPPKARAVLLDYLAQLRHDPNPAPLAPQLLRAVPSLDDLMVRHLAQLNERDRASR